MGKLPVWAFGPFIKNKCPVLRPNRTSQFVCPVKGDPVRWEATNVYNPAAIVKDGVLHLIYRADDEATGQRDRYGNPMVTCRFGHAFSRDGDHFDRDPEPVLYPDNDRYSQMEWDGGCQDMHIVEGEDGRYYMNYTAWTGSRDLPPNSRDRSDTPWRDTLMIASSDDLTHWIKHGHAFDEKHFPEQINYSRSGVVLSLIEGDRLIAVKVGGKYRMYHGHCGYLASSDDLIHWVPEFNENGSRKALFPNYLRGTYADASCEAGAAAILTDLGIVYFFNAAQSTGAESLPWSLSQALVCRDDLINIKDVLERPYLQPEYDWECSGHTPAPCMVGNTIVKFQNKWTIYYGATDHCIGKASVRGDSTGKSKDFGG